MEVLIKKYLFLMLLALSNVLVLNGQKTFQRVFDGKGVFDGVTKTSDGGYLITSKGPFISPSSSEATKGYDAGLLKLDSNYEVHWSRYFASNGRSKDVFYDAIEFEEFYYAVGIQNFHENRTLVPVLVKLDQDGNEIWTKILNEGKPVESYAMAVIDNELWVLVYQRQNGVKQSGYFILDQDGEILERVFFSVQKNVIFRGVNKYKNHYYLIGTTYNDRGIDQNHVLMKLTEDKEVLWMKEYESESVEGQLYEGKQSVTFIKDHLYIGVGGRNEVSTNFRSILKLGLDGELILVNRYEGLNGILIGGDELLKTYQNELFISYSGTIDGVFSPGIAVLNKELELVSHRLYQSENLAESSTSLLTEDGFLILGRQFVYGDDYQGGFLIKTNFDLNSSCIQIENELIITDVTHEYTEEYVYFTTFVNGDLTLTTWDSTYTLDTKVIHNCEETYFTLHDKTSQSYCKEDVVELSIYGKEGAISWNIAPELIIEETDQKIRFIIKEEMIVEAIDNSTDKHYSLSIAMGCSSGKFPDMIVNETISPNDDGFNDCFTVENIEFYPENQVLIVDQRGNKVFSTTGYQNDWVNEDLIKGIYYYSVRKNLSDDAPLKGVLVVKY